MRKTMLACLLVLINFLLLSNASMATDIVNANYGSVVVRGGTLFGVGTGHAGVVISPLFGNQDAKTTDFIAQATGPLQLSRIVNYPDFLGSNIYIGHFNTFHAEWDSPAFRADVVMFANKAMSNEYIYAGLYSYQDGDGGIYPDFSGHWPNHPYTGVVPKNFRCDGLAEWSVEQALAVKHGTILNGDQSLGFYSDNSILNAPINISIAGTDDSAYPLTIDSDSPSSGVPILVDKGDSIGHPAGYLYTSTGVHHLNLLYSVGAKVTMTAPVTAPNGNLFDTWWGCTAENGGTLNKAARTCTTSMNMAAHYTASYVGSATATSDLVPQSITVSPMTLAPGAMFTATWTIANVGNAAASAISTTAVRINQSPTSAAPMENLESVSTVALGAGATVAQSATLTAPTIPATYYVWVIADNNRTVTNQGANTSNDLQHSAAFTVSSPTETTPPSISITSPVASGQTYNTSTGTVNVSGIASDNVGVVGVMWVNDHGGGGTANGTTSWSAGIALHSGANTITVNAYDAAGNSNHASITINYMDYAAMPVITSTGTMVGTVGAAFSYPITATNSPTSYSANGLPPGLSVNSNSGVISGTPTTAGVYSVGLSATNGVGTGTGTLTITIVSIYQGPGEISAVTPSDGAVNQPLPVTLSWATSNPGGGALRYDVYIAPAATDNFFPNNLVSQGQSATSFTVSNLPYNTLVSWGIKAIDNNTGAVRYSRMFHFTTQAYTTPSTGSVSINAGAATTTSYSVILNTTANPVANGVQQSMRFSNDGTHWSDWQYVLSIFPWNLANPNYGGKVGITTYTVYAQFKDDQGNQSATYSDTIDKVAGIAGNVILKGKLYQTIQDAINAANPGDTVYLTEGVFTIPTYMSTPNPLRPHDPNRSVGMVLRPGVTLKGAGAGKTTINFQNAYFGLVDADNAAIEGIDIVNSTTFPSSPIDVLLESASSRIHNCIIRGGYTGIQVGFDSQYPAANSQISNNLIINNKKGIFVTQNASNISIVNNTISYNMPNAGISAQDGSTTTLRNNIIAFNGVGVGALASTVLTMGNNDVYPDSGDTGYNSGIPDQTGINGSNSRSVF